MQPVHAGFPIEKLSVPLIVSYLLHWGLFGALSVQLYLYYLAFPNDKKFTKYLVYGIYIIEFVQTVLFTHDAFAEFGYSFGDIEALIAMNFNWLTVFIMNAIDTLACIGQVFYAYRIFILSKSRIVPLFIICVSLTSSVTAMIAGAYSFPKDSITDLNTRKMSIVIGIWCGASALCDIIIAICMTYYMSLLPVTILINTYTILELMHSNTSFRRTQILVSNLIRLTIKTGTMTAIVVLLALILFLAFPHQTFHGAPSLIVPQLYANAILMMLNSQIRIVGGRNTYTSSADKSITTTTVREIASESTEGAQPVDRIQGQLPVVVITQDVFSDRVGQMKEKLHPGNSISLSV
ncbi:hypothetical protein IW261DRAFT_1650132 [Armillaria novae-zelandiae]|uniref:DUF6534 domain-containing protein n=1 Tax=Armillaria novae-zelandiae TaxID=153914 RepID=A0AA39NYX0_9AGAR|nr:hypothetical protein IW261DRAFT_1650132 [Armillaria novae-zelandiae]